ncbi:MAG: hypothetical protein ACXVEF_05930 [Polyangiales bacterium]
MKQLLVIILVAASLSSVACATHTTKDLAVAKSEGKGMSEAFAGECAKHWPHVLSTASHLGLDTLEQHAPHELLASYQKRGEAGGNFVGVWLEEKDQRCEIRVVSMRRDDAVPTDNDWDTRFFAEYHAAK